MTEPLQQIVEALECGALWAAGSEAEPRIRAALALARSMKQGDGWQMVPKEPTNEIIAAMRFIPASGVHNAEWCIGIGGAIDAYKAMLSAAPSPTTTESDRG